MVKPVACNTFIPEGIDIVPWSNLLRQGEVDAAAVESAIAKWQADPPDSDFQEILSAELEK